MWPLERAHDGAACVFADLSNALHTRFQGSVPLLNPFQRQQIGDVIFVDVFPLGGQLPGRSILPAAISTLANHLVGFKPSS